MNQDRFSQQTQNRAQTKQAVDTGLQAHMGRVYNRMTLGVLITAIVSWFVSTTPGLMQMLLGGPQGIVIMFAPIAVIWFGFKPQTMDSNKLKISFIAISILYGISLSAIAVAFTGEAIARAFFVSVAMFAGLSIFGYTTKKDLSMLGTFCIMGMIGILIMSVIGMFTGFSSGTAMLLNYGTVLVFSGITAWETQMAKETYHAGYGDEGNSRMAWSAALSLYISFIAIFVNMLQIMNNR